MFSPLKVGHVFGAIPNSQLIQLTIDNDWLKAMRVIANPELRQKTFPTLKDENMRYDEHILMKFSNHGSQHV